MGTKNIQPTENTNFAADIRRSVHAQIFDLDQGPREVSRRYGMTDREAVQIAVEVERALGEKRLRAAFADGRRSLLTSYAQKAGMN